jgi:hypothetical protein
MKEDFLHYLWKYFLYKTPLFMVDGSPIEVISPGVHNKDAGPDFFNAKVKIGDTIWAGNVELHVLASDWLKHNHQDNPAYDNVILHVVGKNDVDIKRANGKLIPAIEISCPNELYEQYLYLMQSRSWIPCESFISKINEVVILDWKEALMVERLEEKSKVIEDRFHANAKNWEETFYQTLAANFGFKTNAQPFEMLAKSLPVKYLGKHKDQLPLIEAMLFGQSGLLPYGSKDAYVSQLECDYIHLKNKFKLRPMSGHLWKFSRMRPSNFPTLRLMQFAALIYSSSALMSKIIEAKNFEEVKKYFELDVSEYWQTHYVFEKESVKKCKHFGTTAFHSVVINTIAPFFALYAKVQNQPAFVEKAIDWLGQIPTEQNQISEHWQDLGLKINNAFDSQALIQLKNIYCNNRRCLSCRIGNQVIQHKL